MISALTAASAPFRAYERMRFSKNVAAVALEPAPVFVLGHPRSGTTHLHYLLAQDPQFAYLKRAMSFVPDLSLIGGGAFARLYGALLPGTRPFDNVRIDSGVPAEEEFALMARFPDTFMHFYCFPDGFERYLAKGIRFELDPAELAAWRRHYLGLLRKASLDASGRRLLLKNPMNTGRIPQLLELFPAARFVHIVRDPYAVFMSTRKLFATEIRMLQLRTAPRLDLDAAVTRAYRELMSAYLRDRDLIPPGRLTEVRYEDLVAAPASALKRIYEELRLPGHRDALPGFERYLSSVSAYRTNHLPPAEADIATVDRELGFALEQWRYPKMTPTYSP